MVPLGLFYAVRHLLFCCTVLDLGKALLLFSVILVGKCARSAQFLLVKQSCAGNPSTQLAILNAHIHDNVRNLLLSFRSEVVTVPWSGGITTNQWRGILWKAWLSMGPDCDHCWRKRVRPEAGQYTCCIAVSAKCHAIRQTTGNGQRCWPDKLRILMIMD